MRALGALLAATAVVAMAAVWAVAENTQPVQEQETQVAKAETKPSPESLLGDPYMLTWEKDPRFRGREPFQTVLHSVGSETRKSGKFDLPRTPSEETAFAIKAGSYVEEALAALEQSDFKSAEDRIDTASKMAAVKLVSHAAKEKMAAVLLDLAKAEQQLASVRARASLKEALELAARMQAYFEANRHGEVAGLYQSILALDNEQGLKNAEVAATASVLLKKCAELHKRSIIHIEFSQMELKVEAVSHYPEGKSFAIVNGEVIGEGATVVPDLTIASVEGKKVVFKYKGERIPLLLAE